MKELKIAYINEGFKEFAQASASVEIKVTGWDYTLAVVFTIILVVNIAGIAKYAFKTHVLTLFIMVSNFIVLCYRLTAIVYLMCRDGDEITEENA